MSIVVTPLGANAVNGGFAGVSPWVAGSGVTLGTGDIVVFTFTASGGQAPTGVTVGGVSATLIGTSTSGFAKAWLATGVNTATGNVSIAFGGSYDVVSANWYLITGENTSPTMVSTSYSSFNAVNPLSQSVTVASGGVALAAIMSTVTSGNSNPTTWTNCVASGNTTLEAYIGTGNKIGVSGNYSTGTGTFNITGAGTISYAGTNAEIIALEFAPSGGGGGGSAPRLTLMGVG